MPNVDTPYDDCQGLIIRTDPAKNPTFALTVKEQLDLIASKPFGKKLLDRIEKSKTKAKFGFKVCIQRADNTVDLTGDDAKWNGGNVCVRTSEADACNGKGSTCAIKYNPNVFKTPDGERPPWVGLAHELCHALHNLEGNAISNTAKEEHMTVGLGDYAEGESEDDKNLITENKIRKEHKLKARKNYTGL